MGRERLPSSHSLLAGSLWHVLHVCCRLSNHKGVGFFVIVSLAHAGDRVCQHTALSRLLCSTQLVQVSSCYFLASACHTSLPASSVTRLFLVFQLRCSFVDVTVCVICHAFVLLFDCSAASLPVLPLNFFFSPFFIYFVWLVGWFCIFMCVSVGVYIYSHFV